MDWITEPHCRQKDWLPAYEMHFNMEGGETELRERQDSYKIRPFTIKNGA